MYVERFRKRNAKGYVAVDANVLFNNGGPVANFTRAFSTRVRIFAAQQAPSNKRPRWDHYGKPLKETMRASTKAVPGEKRVTAAVGSTAPYAAYVDQGTGAFAGNSPWEAKILPPYARGEGSLYEKKRWTKNPVMIKGQRGRFFFQFALSAGFRAMGIPTRTVPATDTPVSFFGKDQGVIDNVVGNTPNNAAFRASLEEWRRWREQELSDQRRSRRDANSSATAAGRAAAQARLDNRRAKDRQRKQAQRARERANADRGAEAAKRRKRTEYRRSVTVAQAHSAWLKAVASTYGSSNIIAGTVQRSGSTISVKVWVKAGGIRKARTLTYKVPRIS